ncbi:MAG TPA: DUF4391 domain-containing protein [Pirellulales bacterium]|nr:DUF4391 domain-containing protein [Pirellulales bacterium]
MNTGDIIAALELPLASRLGRRVPKTLLIENGTPTAADKRRINEGIEELIWVAALKPAAIGVPAYRDETREYLEIAVLSLALRGAGKPARMVELVHRAVPYPVLLVTAQAETLALSVAHKRQAQNEAGKVVLDGPVVEAVVPSGVSASALATLRVASQPKTHLLAFYQGWLEGIEAIAAGGITGEYRLARDAASAAARRAALAAHARLTREIAALRSQAEREVQMPRRVELNLKIQRLATELADAKSRL